MATLLAKPEQENRHENQTTKNYHNSIEIKAKGSAIPFALASSSREMGSSLGGARVTGTLGSNFPAILMFNEMWSKKLVSTYSTSLRSNKTLMRLSLCVDGG